MSKFDTLFLSSAAPALWDMFAASMSYNAPGGGTTALTNVLVGDEEERELETDNGVEIVKTRVVSMIIDTGHPQYCGVATMAVNGTATVDSVEYAIIDVTTRGGDVLDATLIRAASRTHSRLRYRPSSSLRGR